jgi:hypothetical protein
MQPLDIDALFIGLGCSLLVAIASEIFHRPKTKKASQ